MDGIGDGANGMGYDMPLLMNQQTPIFGAYNHDGSPVAAALPNPTFHDESSLGIGDDTNDAKRRRIARVSVSDSCWLLNVHVCLIAPPAGL